MFGEKKKIKKEIEEMKGSYKWGYNVPDGMKEDVKKVANEINKYSGKKIIDIDD